MSFSDWWKQNGDSLTNLVAAYYMSRGNGRPNFYEVPQTDHERWADGRVRATSNYAGGYIDERLRGNDATQQGMGMSFMSPHLRQGGGQPLFGYRYTPTDFSRVGPPPTDPTPPPPPLYGGSADRPPRARNQSVGDDMEPDMFGQYGTSAPRDGESLYDYSGRNPGGNPNQYLPQTPRGNPGATPGSPVPGAPPGVTYGDGAVFADLVRTYGMPVARIIAGILTANPGMSVRGAIDAYRAQQARRQPPPQPNPNGPMPPGGSPTTANRPQ